MKPRDLRGRFTPREAPRDTCTMEGCERPQVGRGLCKKHYLRLYRHGDTNLRRITMPTRGPCAVDGCERLARARGMCTKHYRRLTKNGNPHVASTKQWPSAKDRLLNLCRKSSETSCWEFVGGHTRKGYGKLWHNGGMKTAHRVAYEILVGPVPEAKFVLHRCDNPSCLNPDHLFIGTHQDNMADMRMKGRGASERRLRGSKSPQSKLNEECVLQIKLRLAKNEQCSVIAKDFNVDRTLISLIKRGKVWTHVRI